MFSSKRCSFLVPPEIGAIEGYVFVDLAGKKALAQPAVRHEANPEFLESLPSL